LGLRDYRGVQQNPTTILLIIITALPSNEDQVVI